MKEQPDILTMQETEQLCRLYLDCQLTVLEETELGYLLTIVDYHSPLIDEVRTLMGIDAHIVDKLNIKTNGRVKSRLRKRIATIGVAAAIIIILGICLINYLNSISEINSEQSYYIAYADGKRLSDEAARSRIESEKRDADAFIMKMAEIEAEERQIINDISILNISKQ